MVYRQHTESLYYPTKKTCNLYNTEKNSFKSTSSESAKLTDKNLYVIEENIRYHLLCEM